MSIVFEEVALSALTNVVVNAGRSHNSRGLGLEFTRQYLVDGWQVFATCRDPASANELQRLTQKAGARLAIVAMDVTDATSGCRTGG